MLAYDGCHILHTAIAYFNVVLVEKGVILVLSREVFRYELKEDFADVSFHVKTNIGINVKTNNGINVKTNIGKVFLKLVSRILVFSFRQFTSHIPLL